MIRTTAWISAASPADVAGQVIYLDFDGAQNVTYHGLMTVGPFDVPAFSLAGTTLAGQEQTVITDVVSQLQQTFAGAGLLFTTSRPSPAAEYSTVYLGGAGSAFSNDGSFLGLAEQVDVGNGERVDDAWVFADRLGQDSGGSNLLADRLARVTTHEIGHLLGYGHTQ
jgi:hypothetical protein